MNRNHTHASHARSLRADIIAAPAVWLPRREVLLEWLAAFVTRAEAPSYELGETEADDLAALEQFLRKKKIPVAG